ncbi:hypothetical protein P4V47_11730 [Brevibacillus laterosporus]|nr:hypothetical protein [Brevibacillus laterosporus]
MKKFISSAFIIFAIASFSLHSMEIISTKHGFSSSQINNIKTYRDDPGH